MPVQKKLTAPPHDTQAERMVLGSMLRDAEVAIPLVVSHGVLVGDLYHHSYRLVFARMIELFNGDGCDLVTVYRSLARRGELVELDPISPSLWLAELWESAAWNWQDYQDEPCGLVAAIERVLWMSERRDQIHLARTMLRDAFDGVHGPRVRVYREAVAV